ncbi:hypothetical protein ACVWWG_006493 [Bradyrhizobium sp. LB7.2]
MAGELAGVRDRACRSVAVRQHHTVHLIGAERIDRDCRAEGRVDAAGDTEQHTGKAVLGDVITQAEHAGCIVGIVALGLLRDRTGAAPIVAVSGEAQCGDAFRERRQLRRERKIAVEREGSTVKHQLVLAANLVEIDQRQTALGDARDRNRQTHVGLVAGVGRAVRHQNDLDAGLGQRLDHVLVILGLFQPDVLADRHTDPNAAHGHRPRGGAARKQPLLVEHAVIRQVAFEAKRGDTAAIEQRAGIVESALLHPGRADQHGRAAISGLARKRLDRGAASGLEGRLLHEIFRRVAGNEQFRKQHEIGTVGLGLRARGTRLGRHCRRCRPRSD